MKNLLLAILLIVAPAYGQTINPATEIQWPRVTQSGFPTISCTSANYGQPDTDTTNNISYFCSTSGWTKNTGLPPGSADQLLYYASAGNTLIPLTLGANLSINTGVLNASAFGGISALTGPVTAAGIGTVATTITPTGVTPNTYLIGGLAMDVNAGGQITALGPPFVATFNCTQCGTYETGYPGITSASGTISYINPSVPTSASVSDGTNTDTLTTPFTSWLLSHSYSTNTTFTLTALGDGQTGTSAAYITFTSRSFGGVGTAGATGATASGTSAVLAGATGTLGSNGLGSQGSWGQYSPSNQKIYVLSFGSACSFTSGGFAFPVRSPTPISFTNQYGSVVSMYLYESTNLLTGAFTLTGAC